MEKNAIAEIPEDMKEFVQDFLLESDDLITALDNDLVTLESSPDDFDLLNNIFRAAHTIKGTSGFLGLDQITSLTHKMEDVLNRLRKGELKVSTSIMDVILESVDSLKTLIADVQNEKIVARDYSSVIARLKDIFDGKVVESADPTPEKIESSTEELKEPDSNVGSEAQTNESKPNQTSVATNGPSEKAEPAKKADQTIRVPVERLESLMNLIGELVLGRNTLVQTSTEFSLNSDPGNLREKLGSVTSQINFVTTELQSAVMNIRMIPIAKVFNRFPRLVRDLASSSGKKMSLEMLGAETELDKTVIEEIGDPLIHLVRNSCDHGIETPDERKANGKPETGLIKLEASQEGSNIIIKITDDGRGLDVEAIKAKAIERGLTTEAGVGNLSKSEIFNFILAPGFSTAKVVSDISGRGVGMDVVRTNIEKLNGLIEIDSETNVGSTITIKLPLTLAIVQGLLIGVQEDIFIIPLASVHEIVKTSESELNDVDGIPMLRLRDEIVPILSLTSVLKHNTVKPGDDEQHSYVVVVGLAEKKLGLFVDNLLGQEEVVIKSLGKAFGSIEGLAGATILGDGRIRLIVDVIGLFGLAKKHRIT